MLARKECCFKGGAKGMVSGDGRSSARATGRPVITRYRFTAWIGEALVAAKWTLRRQGRGMALSFALHAVAFLLLTMDFGLSPPPKLDEVIAVELVQLGDRTTSPRSRDRADTPQDAALRSPARHVARPSAPPSAWVPAPTPARHRPAKVAPVKAAPAAQDFDSQLRAEERRLGRAAKTSSPVSPGGRGLADRLASASSGAAGPHAMYALKDLVRVQVEPHWNFDVAALGRRRFIVSVHVVLDAEGNVDSATIVDDPRNHTDPAYHALALSARNAVLVSSPIRLPPGTSRASRDMVLNLDSRSALR